MGVRGCRSGRASVLHVKEGCDADTAQAVGIVRSSSGLESGVSVCAASSRFLRLDLEFHVEQTGHM